MTLGGRTGMPAVLATVALTMVTCVWLAFGWRLAVAAVPAAALALLMFLRLRSADYSVITAAVFCAALFAQPQLAPVLFRPDGPIWLSLVMYALAASGADAVEHPTVRPIISLGASLAVVQAIDPIGVYVVAAIVPLLVALPRLRANGMQAVTLAILVLFIPVVEAVLLAHGSASALPAMLTSLGLPGATPVRPIGPFALVSAVGMSLPFLLLPVVVSALRSSPATFAAMLALLVVVAFALAAALGTRRDAYWLAVALIPIVTVIASSLRTTLSRERLVVMASLLSLGFSWAAWSV